MTLTDMSVIMAFAILKLILLGQMYIQFHGESKRKHICRKDMFVQIGTRYSTVTRLNEVLFILRGK